VLILLYLVDILVSAFWRFGIDPDNAATPCLTSIADLLGTTLLVMAFQIIYFLQPGDIDEGIVAYLNSINWILAQFGIYLCITIYYSDIKIWHILNHVLEFLKSNEKAHLVASFPFSAFLPT